MADKTTDTGPARSGGGASEGQGGGGALCRGREIFRRCAGAHRLARAPSRRRGAGQRTCCSAKSSPSMSAKMAGPGARPPTMIMSAMSQRGVCWRRRCAPHARVTALMTPVFAAPDLKAPVRDLLPLECAWCGMGALHGDYRPDRDGRLCPLSPSRAAGRAQHRFCRGGRAVSGRALCLGRQDLCGAGLFRPDPDRAAGRRHRLPARHRHAGKSLGR